MREKRWERRASGQGLVEFAMAFPVAIAVMAAIIQFGILFWGQNTLTQVVRDTGRWEATQQSCQNGSLVVAQANAIAANSSLIGYRSWPEATSGTGPGVNVRFFRGATDGTLTQISGDDGGGCPPKDNGKIYYASVTIRHEVPTFFPGMQYLPLLGTCDATGCRVVISSAAQFRLEPKP